MKTIYKKYNLLLLLLLCQAAAGMAQAIKASAQISGSVYNELHKPLEFATIGLLNTKDSSVVKGALGNDAGIYLLAGVAPGSYFIKVSAVGYADAFSNIIIINNNTNILKMPDINLQIATKTLQTVNIQSSKPLIERKPDRTVMNIENSVLAAGNSALEILQRAPGVTLDKDDNISLKGKKGVTVMINDKLTYLSAAQLATLLRSTDGSTISSIEIITNPSAKYDAAGNSGIINIKLKKNKQTGTNGSLTLGGAYGYRWRDNESVSLNNKQGKINIFGTFSHSDNKPTQDIQIQRIVSGADNQITYFNQYSYFLNAHHNNSYRLGADYDLSAQNTFGFVVNGYANSEHDHIDNRTYIGPDFNTADSALHTVSATDQTYRNFAVNLNDVYKIDTAGQQLSADIDYSKFHNNSNAAYITDFFLPDGSPQRPQAFLGYLTPSVIDIRTAKLDYIKPLNKSLKLESGVKFSNVKSDNDLRQKLAPADNFLSSNHFVYDEKVSAGYINFNKDYKHTSIQLGLRAEYTSSSANGDSANTVQIINRHYFNLFPTLYLTQTLNSKNEIGFNYGRRIDRPQYDNLNPFIVNLDPYTYIKGNPFLKPQYTDNFELNYTYNKNLIITLGYSRTTDVITEIPGTDPATKTAFITNLNLQTQNAYSVNIYTPFTFTKWWEGNVNLNAFYLGFKSNNLEGSNLNRGQYAYEIRATQTFSAVTNYKAELTADYQSVLTYGLYSVKPQYYVDAGISRSLANKKATIKLSVSDFLNILRNDVTSNYQSTDINILQKRETRVTRLTFTYNFGNTKITTRQHQTGADAEKGRVKGGN